MICETPQVSDTYSMCVCKSDVERHTLTEYLMDLTLLDYNVAAAAAAAAAAFSLSAALRCYTLFSFLPFFFSLKLLFSIWSSLISNWFQ